MAPIRGGGVCRVHGGSAPQVKQAAAERIRELVDPAIDQLARLLEAADSDAVKLSAIKDVLDRAGYSAKQRIEHSGAIQSGDRLTPADRAAIAAALTGG